MCEGGLGWVRGEARGFKSPSVGAGVRASNEPPYEIVDSVRVEELLHCGPEQQEVVSRRWTMHRSDCRHDAATIGDVDRGIKGC